MKTPRTDKHMKITSCIIKSCAYLIAHQHRFAWNFKNFDLHYSDAKMGVTASRWFAEPFVQAQIKENIKDRRQWPLWREFTGGRWILFIPWSFKSEGILSLPASVRMSVCPWTFHCPRNNSSHIWAGITCLAYTVGLAGCFVIQVGSSQFERETYVQTLFPCLGMTIDDITKLFNAGSIRIVRRNVKHHIPLFMWGHALLMLR